MSATLGVLLKKLLPDARIDIYERLNRVGAEGSDAWNNARKGHFFDGHSVHATICIFKVAR